MHPVLFRLGPLTIYTYGVLMAAGVLLALLLAHRQAARAGLDPDRIWNLGVYMLLAALVGAKLWLLVAEGGYYLKHVREIFAPTTLLSGGVYYGGLLAAIALAIFYARRFHMGFLTLADVYSAPLALGHAVGRLGCFMAGCCYGKFTAAAWGVTFTNPLAAEIAGTPLGVPLHPTQLYEAGAEFLIFAFLVWLARRPRLPGKLFGAYAVMYGLSRGTIEFFRGDPERTLLAGGAFSLMQVASVVLIALGVWLLWRDRKYPAAATETRPA